jgi:predicted nucleic acid-binding protein
VIVVSDTSPLRALQALEHLDLLRQVYGRVIVPPAVATELGFPRLGLPALDVAGLPCVELRAPSDPVSVARLLQELDPGESEALALAMEIHAERVLIDESEGRRVARRLGLATIGVMGFLVQAKHQGLIPRVGPLMDVLTTRIRFHLSPEVRQQILRDAGE